MLFSNIIRFGILSCLGVVLVESSWAAKPDSKKPSAGQTADKKTVPVTFKPIQQVGKISAKDLANKIDAEINKLLTQGKITPSGKSSDSEFVRRVYLDLIGRIPSADETKSFLDNTASNKRTLLIEELLADDEFGKHMADIWQALLLPRISDNKRLKTEPLVEWLEGEFNKNTSWGKISRELISSTGSQDNNGAVTYFVANSTIDKMTDSISRLFLGVQLQCAQCHNHPFVDWKQNEYWGMAAFFMKVQANPPKGKDTSAPVVNENKSVKRNKKNALPESAQMVNAKFPGDVEPKLPSDGPYRPVFADWMTSKTNPFFSKSMVNRIWSQFFGRGLVDPIDDMHDGNPATHPELLEILSQQFSASDFDIKDLIRAICNSETYQRSSKPNDSNKNAEKELLASMPIKNFTPEQLYDSIMTVVGNPTKNEIKAAKMKKLKITNRGPRSQFVTFFQPEEGVSALSYETGIPQVLRLMNSPQMNSSQTIAKIISKDMDSTKAINTLFLSTLNRLPTDSEIQKLSTFVKDAGDPKQGYSDILWVLLNTSEFTLNH